MNAKEALEKTKGSAIGLEKIYKLISLASGVGDYYIQIPINKYLSAHIKAHLIDEGYDVDQSRIDFTFITWHNSK